MLRYYKGSNQIPGESDEYKFILPTYGKSTTDPTFYEPTATRIANMKKSAGAKLQGIYDFNESIETKGKTKEQIHRMVVERAEKEMKSGQVDLRFSKHGLTAEEISQITTEKEMQVEKMISDKKQNIKNNTETLKKEVAIAEAVSKKLDETAGNSAGNSAE